MLKPQISLPPSNKPCKKPSFFHGYVNMEWIAVDVKDVTPEDKLMPARPSA
jgi:hypothetical protein